MSSLEENSSAGRPVASITDRRLRSRVSNGSKLFVDGRGPWSRRFRDVLAEIVSDLGGAAILSEAQRQLARRCATLAVALEGEEGLCAKGQEIDLLTYGQLTDRLGRAFQRLGLRRVPRNVEPSLTEYLRTLENDEEIGEGDEHVSSG
jgi:hypothetical protein